MVQYLRRTTMMARQGPQQTASLRSAPGAPARDAERQNVIKQRRKFILQ